MIRLLCIAVLAISFAFSVHPAHADSGAASLISTFESACIESNGSQEFIRKWVHKEQFEEVTGTDARKLYAGTVNAGYAWFKQTKSTILIVAIRTPMNSCAVFSSKATQNTIMEYMEGLPRKFAGRWPISTNIKDDTRKEEFGTRRGRVITFGTSREPVSVMITAIANEHPGGPYQATIQAGFSNPRK
jgi:hypothetical protein